MFLEPGTSTGRAQPTPDDATVRALVAAGHAAGLLVVAHATDADAARRAVAAGVDGLVHVWVDGAAPDLVAAVAAADVFVVPTLTVIDGLWGTGAGARTLASEERVAPYLDDVSRGGLGMGGVGLGPDGPALATAAVGALHAAGVAILAGTDAANPGTAHGASVHQELRLLVAAGLTPVEALRSATAEPAARFRLADRGRVAPGLVADLVLVAGDPTRDVTATTAITAVWRRGVRLERESYAAGLAPARSLVDLGGLDPVAATARWVAAERARESARPDALFTDPLADRLAGEPGRALAAWMRGDSQFESPTLPVRTRFFDDAVLAAVGRGAGTPDGGRAAGAPDADRVAAAPTTGGRATADPTTARGGRGGHHPPTDPTPADQPPTENPPANHSPACHLPADHPPFDPTPADEPPTDRPPADQVVVLAAGMDARAYRLDLPAELAWFELDRPALLAVKERELAEVVPRCRRYAIGCDLAEDWPAALLGAGFDPARPAVWLVEGLLAYLDGDLVELLLDRLTALAAPGQPPAVRPHRRVAAGQPVDAAVPGQAGRRGHGVALRHRAARGAARAPRLAAHRLPDGRRGHGVGPLAVPADAPRHPRRAAELPRKRAAVAAPPSPKRRLAVPITEIRRPENGDSPSWEWRLAFWRRAGQAPAAGRGAARRRSSRWPRRNRHISVAARGPVGLLYEPPGRPPDQA